MALSQTSPGGGAALRMEVLEGSIALVTLDDPNSRANTLHQALLGEFESLLARLAARADLLGLVLRSGKPGMFIAGADLHELASWRPDPIQNRLFAKRGLEVMADLEKLPFPTVAAIEGACLGGGLELALACDFRLASSHPKTEIGFPEVKLGLIPGWGGTQRLTRVIGPAPAAELICSGDTVNAGRAQELGIVRAAVPGERLLDEALNLARRARQSGAWREARRHKQEPVGMDPEQQASLFESARARVLAKTKGQLPAPLAALGAIGRGCNLPLEEGLKVETEAFVPLLGSPISANLIAVFFMTQRLQKDPGVADPSVRPKAVNRVGVLGAGIMGAGIAEAHVRRGIPVMLLDNNPAALEKGVAAVTKAMQRRHDAGRMTQADVVASLGRLNTTTVLTTMADRDVVIEAVIENEATKTQLYRDLGPILKAEAILASNTSTISLTRMAEAAPRPEDFAGMHFFNPVDRMRLVEVIRGKRSSDETIATLVALAKRIGKTPIVVRDCPGFLVNRILFPYLNESLALLEEGAGPRAIDGAATAFGMPMGPIALQDLIGLDTCLHAGEVINTAFAERARTTGILRGLVAAGRLGQKSGAGFYRYAKGIRGEDDPAALALVGPFRSGHRGVAQEEMTDRLFLPMLVEASRVLEEGIVREPGDVDMGLILGIGFPSFKGGLLRWADSLGLRTVLEKLRHYEELGPQFRPTERMRQLAAEGKEFYAAGWTERAG